MRKYNIYHRRDGRWEGRISRGKHHNGRRKYQYVFAHTREQVEKKIDEIHQNERKDGVCRLTIRVLFEEWFQNTRHTIKESTAANYMMKAQKHILPMFGARAISQMTAEDISGFIEKKQNSGLSNRYISDILVLLKSIFKYVARVYHIINPMDGVSMPKKKKPDIRLLDEKEQAQLRKYIANHPTRTTVGTALSLTTGLRIGEICALRGQDIDLEKRILTVRNTVQRIQCSNGSTKTKLIITEPKSESSKREVPIPACIIPMLTQFHCKSDEYWLSGSDHPIEPRTMQYRFSRILNNANLPSVHFHALRHIFATNCVRLGFDVKSLSEILGHSSVEITLNRYVHSSFDQKKDYMSRVSFSF